jgi:PLD-like domain
MRRKQWFFSILLFAVSLSFLLYSKYLFPPDPVRALQKAVPITSPEQCGAVLLVNKDYYPFLKEHFRNARHKIVGTVFLLKTGNYRDNEPADLIRELIAARKRNVDVELVIDLSAADHGSNETNLDASRTLQEAGVRVHFDTADVTTHSKSFVIDDRYCFVGSHNLTHSAMAVNEELSVFVDSPEMAKKITDFIRQIPLSHQANPGKDKE